MMYTMVRRRVEDPLQGPELPDVLVVNPELEEEVEGKVHHDGGNGDPQEGEGVVEPEVGHALEDGHADCCGESVVLGGMVHLVGCPQEVDLWKILAMYLLASESAVMCTYTGTLVSVL